MRLEYCGEEVGIAHHVVVVEPDPGDDVGGSSGGRAKSCNLYTESRFGGNFHIVSVDGRFFVGNSPVSIVNDNLNGLDIIQRDRQLGSGVITGASAISPDLHVGRLREVGDGEAWIRGGISPGSGFKVFSFHFVGCICSI